MVIITTDDPETRKLAIEKLGEIGQDTEDENVLSDVINKLGSIAKNIGVDQETRNRAITQLGLIAKKHTTAENKLKEIAQDIFVKRETRESAKSELEKIRNFIKKSWDENITQ